MKYKQRPHYQWIKKVSTLLVVCSTTIKQVPSIAEYQTQPFVSPLEDVVVGEQFSFS
jgi:hypothetical protein